MKFTVISLYILLVLALKPTWATIDGIGIIKSVSGPASITSQTDMTLPAVSNMKIGRGDTIRTGSGGTIGIIFNDDTSLSLGPDSELIVKDFLFEPADHRLSLIARMVRGTFSFISGQIAKLAPEKVQLKTPEATLGVRGTKFVVKVEP